jgi:hypothetical protein
VHYHVSSDCCTCLPACCVPSIQVRLDGLSIRASRSGTYITVGDGASVMVAGCDLHGEVHFRHDGHVTLLENVVENSAFPACDAVATAWRLCALHCSLSVCLSVSCCVPAANEMT